MTPNSIVTRISHHPTKTMVFFTFYHYLRWIYLCNRDNRTICIRQILGIDFTTSHKNRIRVSRVVRSSEPGY